MSGPRPPLWDGGKAWLDNVLLDGACRPSLGRPIALQTSYEAIGVEEAPIHPCIVLAAATALFGDHTMGGRGHH